METGRGYKNVQAELIKFYDMVKKFWKQKDGKQWFQNGEQDHLVLSFPCN